MKWPKAQWIEVKPISIRDHDGEVNIDAVTVGPMAWLLPILAALQLIKTTTRIWTTWTDTGVRDAPAPHS